jgi:hypothetical protein
MVSARRQKPKGKRPAARPATAKKAARPAPKKQTKPASRKPSPATRVAPPASKAAAKAEAPEPELKLSPPDGRHHVLSLSFVRDGDEFLARLETDSGHITEFKNRSLDQLLTLVAGELEDLIE